MLSNSYASWTSELIITQTKITWKMYIAISTITHAYVQMHAYCTQVIQSESKIYDFEFIV